MPDSVHRITCVSDDHENGNIWYIPDLDISVFEDTQGGSEHHAFYAWRGTWDDHDRAEQTESFPTLDEAVDALDILST